MPHRLLSILMIGSPMLMAIWLCWVVLDDLLLSMLIAALVGVTLASPLAKLVAVSGPQSLGSHR